MIYPKVTIIILNWNGKEDTIECLESLKHITYLNHEILLVDNGSTDGSVEYFRERYPGMEIIENGVNLGFAEGNNVGIRRAMDEGADYVLMLNNDTVVDPVFLEKLLKVAESEKTIGVVGPKVYYYDIKNKIQSAGVKLCWNKGKGNMSRWNKIDNGQFDEIVEVDYVSGCGLLAKSGVFKKIGYLNSEYFAYWEETDWCVRAHKAGYKVLYVPKAKIWHKGLSTSKKIHGFTEYHIVRNRFWFMKKHATIKQYSSFLLYFFVFQFWFTSGILLLYHKDMSIYISYLRGVMDGIKKVQR